MIPLLLYTFIIIKYMYVPDNIISTCTLCYVSVYTFINDTIITILYTQLLYMYMVYVPDNIISTCTLCIHNYNNQ